MHPVVHFELPADDRDRAIEFYERVFDWEIEAIPIDGDEYHMATTSALKPADEANSPTGIDGAIIERSEALRAPILSIEVVSIDEHAERIEAAGGSVVVPRTAVPDMGWYAYFEDPEGNVVGLWENVT